MVTMDDFVAIAGANDEGRRADRVVRRIMAASTLSQVYAAMRKGSVRVNGKRVKGNTRIHEGDKIAFNDKQLAASCAGCKSGDAESNYLPTADATVPLDIIFHNEHLLAVNKAAGMATHQAHGGDSVADAVARLYREECARHGAYRAKSGTSLSFRPGPLHRLDRATSGVLVFSQSLAGAKWFTEELRAHRVQKTYLALLEGRLDTATHWMDRLVCCGDEARYKVNGRGFHTVHTADGADGVLAITHVYPLCNVARSSSTPSEQRYTLVRVEIETGRKHQIRCQCAAHGSPLVGDVAYGGHRLDKIGVQNMERRRQSAATSAIATRECSIMPSAGGDADGIFLHCARLGLPSNKLGVPAVLSAPLPAKFVEALDLLLPDCRKRGIIDEWI